MATTDISGFGPIPFDSTDLAITTAWTSLGILKIAGLKTGMHVNVDNDGAAALTHFKISRAATVGGNHADWLVDADLNTATVEMTDCVTGASPPNLYMLANGSQGQFKLDRLQGVAEIQFWAKSAGTNLRITGTAVEMALPSSTIIEVESGGSDTLNGGCFDPANSNMASDGAATAANTGSPVFSSVSYNFVAGDVGAWLFIKSGSNWTPGWYKIVSVASNAATLSAAIGTAVLVNNNFPYGLNATAGCATTASPTSATWTVDYSQGSSAISLTGLTTAAANAIILTASAAKSWVGNGIQITGGTNFTTGFYMISSVSAGVSATVDRTCTSAAGAAGTAGLGGALASPGQGGAIMVAGCVTFVQAATYSITSASTNVAAGCINMPASGANNWLIGYSTLRSDKGRPTLQASGISTFSLITENTDNGFIANFILDGNSRTSSRGLLGANGTLAYNITAKNCTNGGLTNVNAVACEATGCATVAAIVGGRIYNCYAHGNTITGFSNGSNGNATFVGCVSANNTGESSHGFDDNANAAVWINCTAYTNGGSGFNLQASSVDFLINSISYGNAAYQVKAGGVYAEPVHFNNALGTGGSGQSLNLPLGQVFGTITLTGDPFTNGASGDFSLNTTAGAGAVCRAAGLVGAMIGGTSTGYLDLGAIQSQAALPSAADLRSSTVVGSVTGTLVVPSAANVKSGVTFDNGTTGTLTAGIENSIAIANGVAFAG